jgi:hypothetical protein
VAAAARATQLSRAIRKLTVEAVPTGSSEVATVVSGMAGFLPRPPSDDKSSDPPLDQKYNWLHYYSVKQDSLHYM